MVALSNVLKIDTINKLIEINNTMGQEVLTKEKLYIGLFSISGMGIVIYFLKLGFNFIFIRKYEVAVYEILYFMIGTPIIFLAMSILQFDSKSNEAKIIIWYISISLIYRVVKNVISYIGYRKVYLEGIIKYGIEGVKEYRVIKINDMFKKEEYEEIKNDIVLNYINNKRNLIFYFIKLEQWINRKVRNKHKTN